MDHLAYYNEGCEPETGGSVVMGWVRRQFRRILLPASNRLVQILGILCERIDGAENQLGRLRSQLGAFRNQLGTIRSQLGAAQIRLDDQQIRLDDQGNQLGLIPGRFDEHQAQFDEHQARLDDHHDRLGPIAGRLDDHVGLLAAQSDLIAALTTQLENLRHRQEEQAARYPATVAFGWDYVAMTRRLGVLEEHVDAILNPPGAGVEAILTGPSETTTGPTHQG